MYYIPVEMVEAVKAAAVSPSRSTTWAMVVAVVMAHVEATEVATVRVSPRTHNN